MEGLQDGWKAEANAVHGDAERLGFFSVRIRRAGLLLFSVT